MQYRFPGVASHIGGYCLGCGQIGQASPCLEEGEGGKLGSPKIIGGPCNEENLAIISFVGVPAPGY